MENNSENGASNSAYIEQYKAYIQDLGNIGTRHENSRKYYLSVVSSFFVFASLAGKEGVFQAVRGSMLTLVGIAGILLCVVWITHMQSFGALYKAKFDVLREVEEKYGLFHIFDKEWTFLKANRRFKLLTLIDSWTPILFVMLFIAILYLKGQG